MKEILISKQGGQIQDPDALKQFFREMKDGFHRITAKDLRKRSLQQNGYYWGFIIPMVRKALYDAGFEEVTANDDAHEILLHKFAGKVYVNHNDGEALDAVGRSSGMTVPEFSEYEERCCRWASDFLNLYIPAPNEILQDFKDKIEGYEDEAER